MTAIAILMFIPLQIFWLPLSIIGAGLVAYRQLGVSKRLGVSQTAVEILNGRWTLDVFGLREDIPARKLAEVIPNNSVFGLWLALFPLWIVHKLTGVHFLYPILPKPERSSFTHLVASRTAEFDRLIEDNSRTASQLVILGAGLDTRAYGRMQELGFTMFEVDEPANQAHKIAALTAAGFNRSHVHFVEADFGQSNWIKSLLDSAYDPQKRTVFLWEGVTLYLSPQSVSKTLSILSEHTQGGSVVLTDIYADRILRLTKGKAMAWSLELTGETTKFGLDFSSDALATLREFASSNGVMLNRHEFLGSNNKNGPYAAIAELAFADQPQGKP